MRLDPKYFNIFIGSLGIFAIVLIGYFTISYFMGQQVEFKERIGDGEEVRQTEFDVFYTGEVVTIEDYQGRPVVLDFWATWSGRSQQAHKVLSEFKRQYPDLVVLSALVKDDETSLQMYEEDYDYDFTYVKGTDVYQDFLVPGVPTYVIFDRQGEVLDVVVGFRDDETFNRLSEYLTAHEE